jgi:hypothetical protein
MDAFPILLFGGFAVVAVIAIVFGAIAARKRREALSALATRLGLDYRPDKDRHIASQFSFLNRRPRAATIAFNILSGTFQGIR